MNPNDKNADCCPVQNNEKTSWLVKKRVEVVIEVPITDAADPQQATEFANDLIKDLPLSVALGGVPLEGTFV